MDETSKEHAEMMRGIYREVYENVIEEVRKNFNDMDFENADRRAEMETHIEAIEQKCSAQIAMLDAMVFE